jgi:AsmA-like protein
MLSCIHVVIVRRRWVIIATVVAGVTVAALVALATRIPFSSDRMRKKVIATLADRLDSAVELEGLTLRLFPKLHAEGTGLIVRHESRTDVPPLITIKKFTVDADLVGLWRRHVAHVTLEGLHIQVPPGKGDDRDDPDTARPQRDSPAADAQRRDREPQSSPGENDKSYAKQVIVDVLEAPNAELTILRRDKAKQPRTWYLYKLRMRDVGIQSPMPFESLLTNAIPPGEIKTEGTFGPWNRRDPGSTPLDGRFTFDNANLGVFGGISGILSAHGTYGGSLARIAVDGETDTPDFMVTISGHQLPLKTKYHALVDGTNGNTTLDPVNATFLNTSLTAKGGVYDLEGAPGREVRLDVTMQDGRMEDVMRLAVKTPKPPMTGTLHLTTKLVLPPGKIDVIDKLQLDGRFAIVKGRFTDPGVQAKISELSRRASGNNTAGVESPTSQATGPGALAVSDTSTVARPAENVTSDFNGQFKLASGVLALETVVFDVPGAVVEMKGQYDMRQETIDFAGNLFMDAKISEMVTGWKSLVAKVADPLFRKNGKTVIPLKVHGSRSQPEFGVDVKKALTRNTPEAPATVGSTGKK